MSSTTRDQWFQRVQSPDLLERVEALEDLPSPIDDAVQHACIAALDDPEVLVRLAAAESLGLADTDPAREALRSFIQHEPNDLARAHGISSLGLIAQPTDLPILVRAYNTPGTPHDQIHAAAALATAALRLSGQTLTSYLVHDQEPVRTAAAEALLFTSQWVDHGVYSAAKAAITPEDDSDTLAALNAFVGLVDNQATDDSVVE